MTNAATRRPLCPNCQRPQSACICAWVRPTANEVELLLLQHPLEQHEAKGTARLLRLSLARCRLEIGERFDAALWADTPAVLLYPPDAGAALFAPPVAAAESSGPLCLIVLDATWRKSRRMLHDNPALQRLPRLALQAPPPARYALIRKARQAHQLSTLEASLLALQQLEGRADCYAPLWAAFQGFLAQQQAFAAAAEGRPGD